MMPSKQDSGPEQELCLLCLTPVDRNTFDDGVSVSWCPSCGYKDETTPALDEYDYNKFSQALIVINDDIAASNEHRRIIAENTKLSHFGFAHIEIDIYEILQKVGFHWNKDIKLWIRDE